MLHSLVTPDCVNTRSLYVVRGFRCHIFTRIGKLLGMNRAILKPRLMQPLGDFLLSYITTIILAQKYLRLKSELNKSKTAVRVIKCYQQVC